MISSKPTGLVLVQVTKQIHHGLQALQRHKRDLHAVRCWSSTSCTEVLGGWSGFWLTWWTLQLCYKWTANVFFQWQVIAVQTKPNVRRHWSVASCCIILGSWLLKSTIRSLWALRRSPTNGPNSGWCFQHHASPSGEIHVLGYHPCPATGAWPALASNQKLGSYASWIFLMLLLSPASD